MQGSILPYRTTAEELVAWVEARARGRSPGQHRPGALPVKALEGITQTAGVLGFAREGELTDAGRELALAESPSRPGLVREALLAFPPYGELFAVVHERGQIAVEASWIEAWWATRGYGSSPSNRQEGSATLGRLAEYAGLGRYVAGRRGHPTRIEWELAALVPAAGGARAAPPVEPMVAEPRELPAEPASPPPPPPLAIVAMNAVEVVLEGGRSARLELPATLSRADKRRLMELVDLLVAEE